MTKRRVVITGMGAVTPVGKNINDFWAAIREGKCGVGPITLFDASSCPVKIAAEVKDFKPEEHDIDPKEARRMARFTQFLLAASKEAVKDASLTPEDLAQDTTGIVAGTGLGGMDIIDSTYTQYMNGGKRKVSPLAMPQLIPNEAGANVSIALGITGQAHTVCTACASGTDAIGVALDAIRSGRLDICLAGGSESGITDYSIKSFAGMHALTDKFNDCPEKASRPFSASRDGFIMGEGAGCLILEELEHAKARGAKIYAEMAGAGMSADAYHITASHPEGLGAKLVMQNALEDAGLKPEDIDYINVHGTSTHVGDISEAKAIKDVFGDSAYKLNISSTKSMTGHLLGAAGAVEAMATVLAVHNDIVPPTINHEEDDKDEEIDYNLNFTFNKAQKREIRAGLSNTFGFGGHNACVIFKKYVG